MKQAFLKNGDSVSQFCSDYTRFTFEDERKVNLQVEHEVPFGKLRVKFRWRQNGQLEEKSIQYVMSQSIGLEEIAEKATAGDTE